MWDFQQVFLTKQKSYIDFDVDLAQYQWLEALFDFDAWFISKNSRKLSRLYSPQSHQMGFWIW